MAIGSVYYVKNDNVVNGIFDIKWVNGLSMLQKQQNIEALHQAIFDRFSDEPNRIAEMYTKSKTEIGRTLCSFNIKLMISECDYAFESVYQSSKVFGDGLFDTLQHAEWLILDGYEAKRRSQEIQLPLAEFRFNDRSFPLIPKTMFFDWLYISFIKQYSLSFLNNQYDYFTDIEFNPKKMVSTQANTVCKYRCLVEHNLVEEYLQDPIKYYKGGN